MHAVVASSSKQGSRRAYDLTSSAMNRLTRQLMREYPATGTGRFSAYSIPDSSPYSDLARSIERRVFEPFFGSSPAVMNEEYRRYEAHSMFLLVVDRELSQPAGTLRVIMNSENGLKSLNDIQGEPLNLSLRRVMEYHGMESLDRCWDVGTMAVLKPYRGPQNEHFVGTMLYGLFHAAACKAGIEHAVAILDGHAYKQLTEKLAVPFETIAGTGPFEYLGVKGTRASYLPVPRVVPTVQSYMDGLDLETRITLRPFLARVIYAEGLPEPVQIR